MVILTTVWLDSSDIANTFHKDDAEARKEVARLLNEAHPGYGLNGAESLRYLSTFASDNDVNVLFSITDLPE